MDTFFFLLSIYKYRLFSFNINKMPNSFFLPEQTSGVFQLPLHMSSFPPHTFSAGNLTERSSAEMWHPIMKYRSINDSNLGLDL